MMVKSKENLNSMGYLKLKNSKNKKKKRNQI